MGPCGTFSSPMRGHCQAWSPVQRPGFRPLRRFWVQRPQAHEPKIAEFSTAGLRLPRWYLESRENDPEGAINMAQSKFEGFALWLLLMLVILALFALEVMLLR
jgi:hypothetical protein